MKEQSGFSLSEMLISLFLASLITITFSQLYLSSKSQYLKAQELLEINFDLEWVSALLSDSIRKAGFTPCMGIEHLKTNDSRQLRRAIISFQIENIPYLQFQVNRMNEVFTEVVNIVSPTQVVITQSVISNIKHPLMISDCRHAEVHEILKMDRLVNGYLITLTKPLMFTYDKTTYLGEWLEERWFIKPNAEGEKTLHYKLFQTEELSPLVHLFYINTDLISKKQVFNIIIGTDEENIRKLRVSVRSS